MTLLSVDSLKTYFYTSRGIVKAVDGVTFEIDKGKVLGVVGESASGKSVTAHSIMRLVPDPPGKIVGGQILLGTTNLLSLDEAEMRKIRGSRIAMSFQDPMTYLNPIVRVGDQIAEALIIHEGLDKTSARKAAVEAMQMVQIPSAEERVYDYPHQLSGGMRQRILLAIALSCRPELLIADEPTTALDVIVQASILELLKDLKNRLSSIMLITHDLGIVAELADDVCIMYAGKVMERASVDLVYSSPGHPYTRSLLESLPSLEAERTRLKSIEGDVPDAISPPSGCRFHPRCSYAADSCREAIPPLEEVERRHWVACTRYDQLDAKEA
jgi:oligopeptide/dipeptide ABC transporter ATP-binding protein